MPADKKPAGDEHLGKFCYCSQHLRVHATGWCTVHPQDKIALQTTTEEEAWAEIKKTFRIVLDLDRIGVKV